MKELWSVILSLLLVLLCIAGSSGCNREPDVANLAESGWTIAEPATAATGSTPKTVSELVAAGWAVTPTSLPEIERRFGSGHNDWVTFKAQFKPGDTVVRLVAPANYWANSAGWDGYAIVRSDKVVATLVEILS